MCAVVSFSSAVVSDFRQSQEPVFCLPVTSAAWLSRTGFLEVAVGCPHPSMRCVGCGPQAPWGAVPAVCSSLPLQLCPSVRLSFSACLPWKPLVTESTGHGVGRPLTVLSGAVTVALALRPSVPISKLWVGTFMLTGAGSVRRISPPIHHNP